MPGLGNGTLPASLHYQTKSFETAALVLHCVVNCCFYSSPWFVAFINQYGFLVFINTSAVLLPCCYCDAKLLLWMVLKNLDATHFLGKP